MSSPEPSDASTPRDNALTEFETASPGASLDAVSLDRQAANLLIEPESGWMLNYGVMALLAAVIAGLGMRLDSAPIVIGAMLVAPVMRPVLGLGFSLLTAVPARAVRRLLAVLGVTSLGLVGVGWLLSVLIPSTEPELAGEVLARTAPDIRDLLVALAAGSVGAFAILRPKVAETITGVAIAVALVPPPVAAGIALGEGFVTQTWGALLLYGTNLVAIVFGTVVTALLLRLIGERPFTLSRQRITRAGTIVVVLALLVGIPLAGSFTDAVSAAQTERDRRVQQATRDRFEADIVNELEAWIADSPQPNLEIVSVSVPEAVSQGSQGSEDPAVIAAVLLGEEDSYIPPLEGVDQRVEEVLGVPVRLGLRLVGVADQASSAIEVDAGAEVETANAELRAQFESALVAWTESAGVTSRVTSVDTLDSGVISARIALAGSTPPTTDLHRLLAERLGELPQYELIIDELVLSPPVVRTSSDRDDPSAVTALIDGRVIADATGCRVSGSAERYEVAADGASGAALTVDASRITVTADDVALETNEVDLTVQDNGDRSYTGRFDRAEAGIAEVEVVIPTTLPTC